MKELKYTTSGTCSKLIDIEYDPEPMTLGDVRFTGGCHGNLQGIGALVKGMKIDEAVSRLRGIRCREKATSCPDQLARALEQVIANNK